MMNFNPYQHPLFTKYRRTDPETSKQAAADIYDHLPRLQREVMLYAATQPRGFTDEEMNQHFQTYKSSYRSRRSELVEKGLICDSRRTRTQENGKQATVWILKEHL